MLSVHARDHFGSFGSATWSLMPIAKRCPAQANEAIARLCTSKSSPARSRKPALSVDSCTTGVSARGTGSRALFEPIQLQADRGLRCSHGFSRVREAAKVSDVDQSLDGIQVAGAVISRH